jgi:hypothetical protein
VGEVKGARNKAECRINEVTHAFEIVLVMNVEYKWSVRYFKNISYHEMKKRDFVGPALLEQRELVTFI